MTVKRVVYTSSTDAMTFNGQNSDMVDEEESWTDVDFIRAHFMKSGGSYYISKTLTERAALAFAEKHGLDVVTIAPFIHGPFICPNCPGSFICPDCPGSVHLTMPMILGMLCLHPVASNLRHLSTFRKATSSQDSSKSPQCDTTSHLRTFAFS